MESCGRFQIPVLTNDWSDTSLCSVYAESHKHSKNKIFYTATGPEHLNRLVLTAVQNSNMWTSREEAADVWSSWKQYNFQWDPTVQEQFVIVLKILFQEIQLIFLLSRSLTYWHFLYHHHQDEIFVKYRPSSELLIVCCSLAVRLQCKGTTQDPAVCTCTGEYWPVNADSAEIEDGGSTQHNIHRHETITDGSVEGPYTILELRGRQMLVV